MSPDASAAYTIDSHAHLYFDRFDEDRADVMARARAAGFRYVLNVGIDLPTSRAALGLAGEYPGFCFATAGLHPTETNVDEATLEATLAALEALIEEHPREFRAVGEIGFDFHWDRSPRDRQEVAFRRQMDLAERVGRPVIIHCREGMTESLEVVAEYADRVPGVFHCFSGNAADAERVVELGWKVSFAGNVTFPKAGDLREAAQAIGPAPLLLETDAPFLAPQAVRGQRNEPVHSLHTLEALAVLLEIPTDELAAITTGNAEDLFGFTAAAAEEGA